MEWVTERVGADLGPVGGVDGVSDVRLDDSLVPVATSDRRMIAPRRVMLRGR